MDWSRRLVKTTPLSWTIRAFILTLILAIVLSEPIALWTAGSRARSAANRDLAGGHFKVSGRLFGEWKLQATLLRERYGIELRPSLGCLAFQSTRAYAQEYDAVQRAGIIQRFGRDVVQECEKEARESRLPEKLAADSQREPVYEFLRRAP